MSRTTSSQLRELLTELAHGRRDVASYVNAHREVVLRELSTWQDDDRLRPFATRVPYYCLECEYSDEEPSPQRRVAELTFDFLVGERDREEYVRRLRLEFAILDQLNSVPWAYGIRTRHGSDEAHFTPLIEAGHPIDPGKIFPAVFRTTAEQQEWVRIELRMGRPGEQDSDACELIFTRRLQLNASLPKGHPIFLFVQRVGERGLRLSLEAPEIGDPRLSGDSELVPGEVCWQIEDSCGFHQLADVVSEMPILVSKRTGSIGLRLLIEGCLSILNQHWQHLAERDAQRLTSWVMQTTAALERRDDLALRSVLTLFLEDLQQARNVSAVSVLEGLLVATRAPTVIMKEFRHRARALFQHEKVRQNELRELWGMVEHWRDLHPFEASRLGFDLEKREEVHVLFDLLDALRRVMPRWGSVVYYRDVEGARIHRLRLGGIVADVLAFESLSADHRAALETLAASLEKVKNRGKTKASDHELDLAEENIEVPAADRSNASFVYGVARYGFFEAMAKVTALTVEALLERAPATDVDETRLSELARSLRTHSSAVEEEVLKARLVGFVEDWHEQWREESDLDVEEEFRQVAVLQDLLFALEEPEKTDEAIARILRQQPLESGVLNRFAADLRGSDWFIAAPESTRGLVDEHLETLEGLSRQWQRIADFQANVLREYLSPYKDRLPADAQAVIEVLDRVAQDHRELFFRVEKGNELAVSASPEALELLEVGPQVQEGRVVPPVSRTQHADEADGEPG